MNHAVAASPRDLVADLGSPRTVAAEDQHGHLRQPNPVDFGRIQLGVKHSRVGESARLSWE